MNTTTTICEAIQKNGKKCCNKAKSNSLYCGVHKNYVNTSAYLFSDDEKKIELKNNNKISTMTSTTEKTIELTINFFDGSNMKIHNAKGMSIEDIRKEINKVKTDIKMKQMSIFVVGEDDELTKYNNQELLFCLFKEADELIIDESDHEISDKLLERDYKKMGEYINEECVRMFDNNEYDIDELNTYIWDEMADNEFNDDATHSQYKAIWKDDDEIFTNKNGSSSPSATLVKFHAIKQYINDVIQYEEAFSENIDMDNYKQLYALALANEYCANLSVSSTKGAENEEAEIKEGIEKLVIKKMYWEVNDMVCDSLDDRYESDEDEEEGETDEEKRTRLYTYEFENCAECYCDTIEEMEEDDLTEHIKRTLTNSGRHEFHIKQDNHELYLPDCLGNIERSRKIMVDIIKGNWGFNQELYDKYI